MNDLDMSTQARARRALAVPILRFLEIAPLDEKDMTKGMSFTLTSAALNAVGGAHAGALATVLEVAAYLAIVGGAGSRRRGNHPHVPRFIRRADTSGFEDRMPS